METRATTYPPVAPEPNWELTESIPPLLGALISERRGANPTPREQAAIDAARERALHRRALRALRFWRR